MIADTGSSAGGWVLIIVIAVIVIAKLQSSAKRSGGTGVTKEHLTDVASRGPDGSPRCPNCGGQQFTAKRSVIGKLGFGVLAAKSQVRCVTCGTVFKRG
jgi:hypothetical protein